jgi:hypothetical protein
VGRGSRSLGLSLGGGEVHHQDPLRLGCRLAPQWLEQQGRDYRLLAGELVSSLRHLLLGAGLPSAEECDVARRTGDFAATVPAPVVEPSSKTGWPKCPPSMVGL